CPGEAQPPQADVVRDARPADGAEVDRVERLERVEGSRVDHPAGVLVVLADRGELLVLEGDPAPGLRGEPIEYSNPLGHDFLPDSIPWDDREAKDLIHALSLRVRRPGAVDRASALPAPGVYYGSSRAPSP